jgi:hypothetical protein
MQIGCRLSLQETMAAHFFQDSAKIPVFFKNALPINQKSRLSQTKSLKLRLTGISVGLRLREKIAPASLNRATFFLGNRVTFILLSAI